METKLRRHTVGEASGCVFSVGLRRLGPHPFLRLQRAALLSTGRRRDGLVAPAAGRQPRDPGVDLSRGSTLFEGVVPHHEAEEGGPVAGKELDFVFRQSRPVLGYPRPDQRPLRLDRGPLDGFDVAN